MTSRRSSAIVPALLVRSTMLHSRARDTTTCARLAELGAAHEVVESPQFDLKQIYLFDPNGVRIEINIRGE